MNSIKKYNNIFIFAYLFLFLIGIKTLFHGFPDTERFFAEWMDERIILTSIMKFGTLNFAPSQIWHPPLYHYLTFVPIAIMFVAGRLLHFFHDKADFVSFYFNNTHYFFFIGRTMSYVFYWLSALMIFKITRLFYNRIVSHITVLSYLLIPRFIFDFSTTRPESLLFLTTSMYFYFFLRYYLDNRVKKYLFLAAFILGASIATKYNALYLGSLLVPLLLVQLRNEILHGKKYKEFLALWSGTIFFIFLGFFICDPFFIIQFKRYFYNLMSYNVEARYYWKDSAEAILGSKHLKELISTLYLNLFGFFILVLGAWSLFKKDKKLFGVIFFSSFIYEIYFGVCLKNYSPLRYLNPLIPMVVLMLGSGIDFIINRSRKLIFILIMFILILAYNYFDIWKGLSFGLTYIQKARAFIERTVPEFTTICIASNNYIPQLNMTRESYDRLIKTAPVGKNIKGHELLYRNIDSESSYDSAFKELRIKSLMKKPQYNLIRWDDNIKTEEEVVSFLKKNSIQYILSNNVLTINNRKLDDTRAAFLIREFKPGNQRIYRAVFGDTSLFIYKVN